VRAGEIWLLYPWERRDLSRTGGIQPSGQRWTNVSLRQSLAAYLPALSRPEIDRIMQAVRETPYSLGYDHRGLHKYDYYAGEVVDEKA
jgi:hypothetical protein